MLHVITGERPIPSFRKSNAKIVSEIYECAKNSFFQIDTPLHHYENGVGKYPTDIMHTNKKVGDSWKAAPRTIKVGTKEVKLADELSWEICFYYLKDKKDPQKDP
jgi:hypothetical protein